MIWDLLQQLQINKNEYESVKASMDSASAHARLDHIDRRLDAMSLAMMAIWELLAREQGLTQKQLEQKIEEIDMRDGKLDGKVTATGMSCPDCGHRINPRREHCFWCGAKRPSSFINLR